VNSAWLPAVEESAKAKDEQESNNLSTEEEEAFAQEFKEKMTDIPWVGAAARAAQRQEKAKNRGKKKKSKGEKKEAKGEGKIKEV
jgi:hypothetical protein